MRVGVTEASVADFEHVEIGEAAGTALVDDRARLLEDLKVCQISSCAREGDEQDR